MLRLIFFVLLLIHGLIHFLGFAKTFQLLQLDALRKPISKTTGVIWLLTTVLFLISAILFQTHNENWWKLAVFSVCFSQVLIFAFWQDSKFATVINLLIGAVIFISYGQSDFRKTVESEVTLFLAAGGNENYKITGQSIRSLPEIVQRWLTHVNMIDQPVPKTVHTFQTGRMKTDRGADWLSVFAEQWFTVEQPGFIWRAEVGAGSILQFSGRDQFIDAKGEMLIKAYGLFEIVNANGPKINQGAAVRFLSEIIWFPAAATADYITWTETDSLSATATFSYLGQTVSGVFTFNQSGQLTQFLAARFYDKSGKLENWLITIDPDSEKQFSGVIVPTKATVTWQLDEGEFTWFELEIKSVEYQ